MYRKTVLQTKRYLDNIIVHGPADTLSLWGEEEIREQREIFQVATLNTKNKVKRVIIISIGSINASIVHPREILREAIKDSAASFILMHNHPTGDPNPSKEDIEFSIRMKKCGLLMGITMLDHIIVGWNSSAGKVEYLSMREGGYLP